MSTTTGLNRGTRDTALERDKFACFRCGTSILTSVHTLHGRRTGPTPGGVANVVTLCGTLWDGCRERVEYDRPLARRLGFLIRPGVDPLQVPILHHDAGWVLLDAAGTWRKADEKVVERWEDECA